MLMLPGIKSVVMPLGYGANSKRMIRDYIVSDGIFAVISDVYEGKTTEADSGINNLIWNYFPEKSLDDVPRSRYYLQFTRMSELTEEDIESIGSDVLDARKKRK